jgi:AbiV family abortive infection protein
MMETGEDKLRAIVGACHANARSLISSAKLLVDHGGLMSAAYHLALLAIEETGKAALLKVNHLKSVIGSETTDRKLDDHFQKLFWAFFLPSAARNKFSPKELEDARLLAKNMHDRRLDSLYVSTTAQKPLIEISKEEAERVVRLAEARLDLEEGVSTASPNPEQIERLQWLLEALEDDERRRFVLSKPSFERLQADGTLSSWIDWLRATLAQQQREMQELLAKELEKQQPNSEEAARAKWKIKIRFLCVSHGVRQKALNVWNESVSWIKLFEGVKKKRELVAEIHLPEAVPVGALWHAGYGESRRLMLALNIGSLGFFWWYSLNRENHFYEEITDVQKDLNLDIGEQNPYLYVDWGKRALSEQDLRRALLCYSFLPGPRASEKEQKPFGQYLAALAFLGKTDLHLNLTANACGMFFRCLRDAMLLYGDVGEGETFADAFTRYLLPVVDDEAERRSFVDLFAALERAQEEQEFSKLTLDKVLQTKALCDGYLLHTFQRKAREAMHRDA